MSFYLRILSFYLRDLSFRVLFGLLLEFTIKGVYSILKILFRSGAGQLRTLCGRTVSVGICGRDLLDKVLPRQKLFSSVFLIIKEMKKG